MIDNEYLNALLEAQTLHPGSPELKALDERRKEVESLLRVSFPSCEPTIRYGGSRAKGTMIKDDYDLDLTCYFAHDQHDAGETLKDIYDNVRNALATEYTVQEKTSAIRLRDSSGSDFHVDVVPGRFIDASESDTFLHQRNGEKEWLKTNLQVHIDHIAGSSVRDAIRLMKLWRCVNSVQVRTFPLELLVIELLGQRKTDPLSSQIKHVLTELRDNVEAIHIEDPANPYGNDLSSLFNDSVRHELASIAGSTLQAVGTYGWEHVFGPSEEVSPAGAVSALQAVAATSTRIRPWCES